jgi:hypothetical protein
MPNVTPLVSLPEAWHWSLAPGFDFAATLSEDRAYILQLYALNSYDEELIRAVLAFARDHGSELIASVERPLTAVDGFSHPGSAFDIVVAIGPTVHRYHQENPDLHEATRAVLPAYRCEFSGKEDEVDTQFRYARAAGVPVSRLDREPHPYLKMRHKTESGRVISKRGFVNPWSFIHELGTLENSDRFVEFENYLGQVWQVTWSGAWILTDESGERRELGLEELFEFAKINLYGPNLDAGISEFLKRP